MHFQIAGTGVTAGAHRLWAHRAYKVKWTRDYMGHIDQEGRKSI